MRQFILFACLSFLIFVVRADVGRSLDRINETLSKLTRTLHTGLHRLSNEKDEMDPMIAQASRHAQVPLVTQGSNAEAAIGKIVNGKKHEAAAKAQADKGEHEAAAESYLDASVEYAEAMQQYGKELDTQHCLKSGKLAVDAMELASTEYAACGDQVNAETSRAVARQMREHLTKTKATHSQYKGDGASSVTPLDSHLSMAMVVLTSVLVLTL